MIKFKSFEDVCKPSKGQTFDYLIVDYVYNEDTRLLSVSPNKKDLFEYINSFSSSSLDSVLDKYSSLSELDISLPVQTRENYDLITIADAFAKADSYRESRNLSPELDYKQIYQIMLKESQDLDLKLRKGGEVNDEKKAQNSEKGFNETVSQNGEKSS